MPFEQRVPHPLTENAIRHYAPTAAGIYGMSNAREWIYIGQADDIQERLLQHLLKPEIDFKQATPTGFVFEACEGTQQRLRRNRLVLEYAPCRQSGFGA